MGDTRVRVSDILWFYCITGTAEQKGPNFMQIIPFMKAGSAPRVQSYLSR